MTSASPRPALPAVGDLAAGRYRILRELGRGGYGVVYLAHQEAIARDVAIKILLPEVASDQKEVERFRREVFHASSLSNRHTITLYDYGRFPEGLFFVAMEYLKGVNLRTWLHQHHTMNPPDARRLLEQCLRSLDEAHRCQLVHRDIKPENIFVGTFPETTLDLRILDFGLSKFIGAPGSTLYRGPSLTADGEICGTPQYMSPEHAYGEDVGPPSDIYSLGLVLYELLIGEPAFDGSTSLEVLLKQVKSPLPELPEPINSSVLGRFICKATEKEAADRFDDAGAVLEWLCQFPEDPIATSASKILTSQQPLSFAPTVRDQKPAFAQSHAAPFSSSDAPRDHLQPTRHDTIREHLSRFELRLAPFPLVGRKPELAHLDAWYELSRNCGGLFGLTGDAGIGKTALLDTWIRRLPIHQRMTLLQGGFTKHSLPLDGLQKAFVPLLSPHSSAPQNPVRLSSDDVRLLADELSAITSSQRRAPELLTALRQTLETLSTDGPVVLVLENIQHADALTRRFLDRLCDSLIECPRPISIVLTARKPAALHTWTRRAGRTFDQTHLLNLPPSDTRQLLHSLFPTSPDLSLAIIELSSGNPALLAHICRYLLESDLLLFNTSRKEWTLANPSLAIEDLVPIDLQQIVIERADRHLSSSTNEAALRSILHRAVLLGDQFSSSLMAEVLRLEQLVDLAALADVLLEELVTSGLLQHHTYQGHNYYSFARSFHRLSLIRMVESLDDWRHFHLHVARLLHDQFSTDPSTTQAAAIAEHFEKAHQLDDSLHWWLRAAAIAEEQQDLRGALANLQRAEFSLRRQTKIDPELAGTIRFQQGQLLHQAGEFGPAEDALNEAVHFARNSENTALLARSLEFLANSTLLQGRLDETQARLREAADLYEVVSNREGIRRIRLTYGNLLSFRGEYEKALRLFTSLRDNATRENDPSVKIGALIGLCRCAFAAGELTKAAGLVEKTLAYAEDTADTYGASLAYIEAAYVYLYLHGLEAAETMAHRALALARQNHDILTEANAHLALGVTLRRSTHLDRAALHAARARELHESIAHIYGLMKSILLQAEIQWAQGDVKRAFHLSEDTISLHKALGDRHGLLLSSLFNSLFLIEMDQASKAKENLTSIINSVSFRGFLSLYQPQTLLYLGMAEEALGHTDEAFAAYRKAQELATQIGHRELVSLSAISLAKLALITGNIDGARRKVPLALTEALHLGHAHASMFALLATAILAQIDQDPDGLRDAMMRLQPYLITPNAPNMNPLRRLQRMKESLHERPRSPNHQRISEAIQHIASCLK